MKFAIIFMKYRFCLRLEALVQILVLSLTISFTSATCFLCLNLLICSIMRSRVSASEVWVKSKGLLPENSSTNNWPTINALYVIITIHRLNFPKTLNCFIAIIIIIYTPWRFCTLTHCSLVLFRSLPSLLPPSHPQAPPILSNMNYYLNYFFQESCCLLFLLVQVWLESLKYKIARQDTRII